MWPVIWYATNLFASAKLTFMASETHWIYRICIVCAQDLHFFFCRVKLRIHSFVFFFSSVWCSNTYCYDLNRLFCTAAKCSLIVFILKLVVLFFFCYCVAHRFLLLVLLLVCRVLPWNSTLFEKPDLVSQNYAWYTHRHAHINTHREIER